MLLSLIEIAFHEQHPPFVEDGSCLNVPMGKGVFLNVQHLQRQGSHI